MFQSFIGKRDVNWSGIGTKGWHIDTVSQSEMVK